MNTPCPRQEEAGSVRGLHKERPDPPDEQVIREVLAGNTDRFGILHNRYADEVRRYLNRVVFDKSEVESLCQLVWCRAFRYLPSFDRNRAFLPWLMAITRNVARSYMRQVKRQRKRQTLLSLDAMMDTRCEPSCPGPAEEHEHKLRLEALRLALAPLPVHLQVTLVKHVGEGVPYEEIERETGRKANTLASDVFRALPVLKRQIKLQC